MLYPSVINVKPLENFILLLKFDTSEIKVFDMKPYLNKGKFQEIANPEAFKNVRVSFDSVEWANGADIDPELLNENSQELESNNS